jgi:hypothetical protein
MTYTDLANRLATYLIEQLTEANFVIALPAIIEAGELRCYRELSPVATRATAASTLAQGAYTFALPADFVLGNDVYLTPTSGTARISLLQRDPTFLAALAPDPAAYTVGTPPKYWAEDPAGSIVVAPAADTAYATQTVYCQRPAPLSATNATTWLSLHEPDLMFNACMVAGSGYTKNFGQGSDNPQMALSWEQQYQTALAGARREESRRKGEGTFDSSFTPPPTSGMP